VITKRVFDLFFTISGFILLLPLFLIISLCIKLDSEGPVIFRQIRVGRHGKHFYIWKFRTMVVDAQKIGKQLTVGADPRITRMGFWLRKFKLDELPQLINVLKGDMSLVGPRPEVPKYVAYYSKEQRKVLELLPGITDMASIKYRNENDILALASDPERIYIEKIIPEKIELNLAYATKANIWRDFIIIINTLLPLKSSPAELADRTQCH